MCRSPLVMVVAGPGFGAGQMWDFVCEIAARALQGYITGAAVRCPTCPPVLSCPAAQCVAYPATGGIEVKLQFVVLASGGFVVGVLIGFIAARLWAPKDSFAESARAQAALARARNGASW